MKELTDALFQRFELDVDKFNRAIDEAPHRENLYKAGAELRKRLIEKGYLVFECGNSHGTAPQSIIIGREFKDMKNCKQDFYSLAGELGLPYSSSDFYTLVNELSKK